MARRSRKNIDTYMHLKYKVGIYARLSADKESDSIENQVHIVREFFKDKKDCRIVRIYTEKGVSGSTFFRSAFEEMEKDIENGIINCIAVKDLSRLGRNYIETAYFTEKIFPEKGVRFISVNDMYDSENHTLNMLVPFKNMMNEFYIRDISMKITSSLNAVRRSKHIGAVPYGYARNEKGHLIPDKNAQNVQLIFLLKNKGLGCSEIADILNEKGIPTPSAEKYKSKGSGFWRECSVRNILKNPVYKGITIINQTVSEYTILSDGKRKKTRIKGSPQCIYGLSESIV